MTLRGIVTGGAGFLGSHVADGLAAAEHDVTVFDLVPSTRHRSIVGDLGDADALRAAFADAEFVCHLAAVGDVYLAAADPALAATVNVVGTANVCEAALRAGVARVVVASTWEVYGAPRYEPVDEEHPCAPDHPYSVTKLAGEQIARAYARLRGLDVVVLRLGTAFGTRMRPNSVFAIFVRRALAGELITIQGTGEQSRQFTHASDIARAFASALGRGERGAAYNIVGDRAVTIRELADAVAAVIPATIAHAPPRPGDMPSARVSNARARRELGWSARVPFEDGLREIIEEARAAVSRVG